MNLINIPILANIFFSKTWSHRNEMLYKMLIKVHTNCVIKYVMNRGMGMISLCRGVISAEFRSYLSVLDEG